MSNITLYNFKHAILTNKDLSFEIDFDFVTGSLDISCLEPSITVFVIEVDGSTDAYDKVVSKPYIKNDKLMLNGFQVIFVD